METLTMPEAAKSPKTRTEPVLIRPSDAPTDREALAALRRFHLAGRSRLDRPALPSRDIVPALLHAYRESTEVRTDYPVFVPVPGGPAPSAMPLSRLLETLMGSVGEHRLLGDNLLRLERNARDILAGRGRPAEVRALLREAGDAMVREIKLGKADVETLKEGLSKLVDAVPKGMLVPFTSKAPIELLRLGAEARRASAWTVVQKRIRETAERTAAFLEKDLLKRPGGHRAGAVQGAMGEVGSRFVDASALAGMAGASGRGEALSEARRRNLESALERLESAQESLGSFTLFHEEEFADLVDGLEGWRLEAPEDPCEAAARRFDEAAENLARVLRAERLARLEIDGIYDPDRHDPWIARMDWRMFTPEELALVPAMGALVSADHLARRGLPALSRLLLSGRPVQVVVIENPAHNPGTEAGALAGFRLEAGYLGLSHREAFVQQTSQARPVHMMTGFARALAGTRTALHVVAAGSEGPTGIGAWLTAGAALEARAHPFFHYDPEAGHSWARRLDFDENPHPEADWPVYELAARTDAGTVQSFTLAFTFADFALLDPAFAGHFQVVPPGIPEGDLVTTDLYLRMPEEDHSGKIPFVWGVDGEGRLTRLAITRELALAARDRLAAWHTLQELAGIRNEYVEVAAQKAREAALAEARVEREALEAAHAEALERLRRTAAEETVTRLTAALLDVDFAALAAPASPLDALRGRSVDEVAKALLEAADPNRPEETSR